MLQISQDELSKAILTAYRNGQRDGVKPFDVDDAIALLRADLIWSADFEGVREELACLLDAIRFLPQKHIDRIEPALTELVKAILDA